MRPSRQEAWCYLSQVAEPPNFHLAALLLDERVDPVELALKIRDRQALPPELLKATGLRAGKINVAETLAQANRVGARLLTRDCETWPGHQLAAAFAGIDTNRENAIAPIALWATGQGNLNELCERAVTIVGTRASSQYGTTVAHELAADLAAAGYTIISGGALGIDAAAHHGALTAGGATIAVAAHGPGVAYPKTNEHLFDQITDCGLVVSEYAPGARPHRHRFLTRNRLAAAFGQAAVLVEAGYRSGALSTVSWAEAMGRPVAAVPGPVTSRMSVACHERIRDQRAVLISGASQVRELIETIGTVPEAEQLALALEGNASTAMRSVASQLTRSELRVFDALVPGGFSSAEEVAGDAGLGISLAVHVLVSLQQQGLVVREGSKWSRSD